MKSEVVIRSMRVPFLILTPVCVFLGMSNAIFQHLSINLVALALAFVGALLAHVSVNTINEYCDFESGLDLTTNRTSFSGGSGALPENPDMALSVLGVGVFSLVATFSIGVYFYIELGFGIVPIGVVGLLLIVTYTGWINKHPLLCLLAPGLGFGVLMVLGTHYVLAGEYSRLSWVTAAIPFFLVNNLLLLNQYPDLAADRRVGRNHFPIAYTVKGSNIIYALFLLLTVAVLVGSIFLGILPGLSLIALIPMPLALYSLAGAIVHGEGIGSFPQYLASNVAVTILTPLLLGVSLIIS
ncbi:MAG: 1,4-dihydroxy-2-naphthoate octaprenyltransferase [Gammaproteobacteria bacterium]|jgi:1,4-dihydroxy-2-naphthoate octaprenyltransferase